MSCMRLAWARSFSSADIAALHPVVPALFVASFPGSFQRAFHITKAPDVASFTSFDMGHCCGTDRYCQHCQRGYRATYHMSPELRLNGSRYVEPHLAFQNRLRCSKNISTGAKTFTEQQVISSIAEPGPPVSPLCAILQPTRGQKRVSACIPKIGSSLYALWSETSITSSLDTVLQQRNGTP